MKKNYQTKTATRATVDEIVLPETVTVAMTELAGAVREGLLALAVGAGLQVMQTLMVEDVTALCGPKGRHALQVVDGKERRRPLRSPQHLEGGAIPVS